MNVVGREHRVDRTRSRPSARFASTARRDQPATDNDFAGSTEHARAKSIAAGTAPWRRTYLPSSAELDATDLTVERLGELAGMSPRNFTRVFAREIGMTPGKFVELSRLESARQYLEQSTMPVSEIAHACGYSTTDGMRLAFDRNLGVTPREYRLRFC